MKTVNRLYSIIIFITIPFLVVLLALNITFRSPEVYSYYFNDSLSIDYTTLDLTSNELADQLGSFTMDMFNDEVNIVENSGYAEDPVFDDVEAEVLLDLRAPLTKSLVALLIILTIDILIYVYFVKKELHEELFKAQQYSIILSGILIVASGVLLASKGFRSYLYGQLVGINLKSSSVLATLFSKGNFWAVADVTFIVLSIIILALVIYITWLITKPNNLFNRR